MAFIVYLTSVVQSRLASVAGSSEGDIWIKDEGRTTIDFNQQEFISVMTSYDYKYLVFMTLRTFEIYELLAMSVPSKVSSIEHGLENVEAEYLTSFFTQQYICYLTPDVFYFFKLSDDKRRMVFREEYPANYFGVEGFSNIFTINLWRGVAFIKTGFMTVHFFDFTPVKKPKAVKLALHGTGLRDIVQLKTFGLDLSVAVRYEDDIITIFDVSKQQALANFYFEGITYSNYDLQSNQYIVLLKNSTAKVIDCKAMAVRGDISFPAQMGKTKVYRTGTSMIALVTNKQIFYYSTRSLKQVTYLNVPSQRNFSSQLMMSNLVMTLQENTTNKRFELMEMDSDSSIFCHESCKKSCNKPFVPCKKFGEAYIALGLASALVVALIIGFDYLFKNLEKRMAEREKMSQQELNELKQSMIMQNPLGASILIKERRSQRKNSRSSISMLNNSRNSIKLLDDQD